MQTRRIGRTALAVTEYSFGTAGLGGLYRECTREAAMATLDAAWEAGIRYFDTAPFYGLGLAERRVGDFLRDKPRDSFVLSTKVGRLLHPVPENQVPDYSYVKPLNFDVTYDYGYDAIMRSVEMSYARLGLNRIDILYVHDIGGYTHGAAKNAVYLRQLLDSGLKALDELKSSGVISAYGLGVNEVPVCLDVMRQPTSTASCLPVAIRSSTAPRLPSSCRSARRRTPRWSSAACSIPAFSRPDRSRERISITCPRPARCAPKSRRWSVSPESAACRWPPRPCSSRWPILTSPRCCSEPPNRRA